MGGGSALELRNNILSGIIMGIPVRKKKENKTIVSKESRSFKVNIRFRSKAQMYKADKIAKTLELKAGAVLNNENDYLVVKNGELQTASKLIYDSSNEIDVSENVFKDVIRNTKGYSHINKQANVVFKNGAIKSNVTVLAKSNGNYIFKSQKGESFKMFNYLMTGEFVDNECNYSIINKSDVVSIDYVLVKRKITLEEYRVQTIINNASSERKRISGFLLLGEPGVGKSRLSKLVFSKWTGVPMDEVISDDGMFFASCYEGLDQSDMLFDFNLSAIVKGQITGDVKYADLALSYGYVISAFKSSQTRKTMLVMDEIDKTMPSVDAFFLTAMEEGFIYDTATNTKVYANLDNLIIGFTSNGNRELQEPMFRRLVNISMKFPEKPLFIEILKSLMDDEVYEFYGDRKIGKLVDSLYSYRSSSSVSKRPVQNQLCDFLTNLKPWLEQKDSIEPGCINKIIVEALTNHWSNEKGDLKIIKSLNLNSILLS